MVDIIYIQDTESCNTYLYYISDELAVTLNAGGSGPLGLVTAGGSNTVTVPFTFFLDLHEWPNEDLPVLKMKSIPFRTSKSMQKRHKNSQTALNSSSEQN